MLLHVKAIAEYAGGEIEENWKMNCQLIEDFNGDTYINTPYISGDTFEVGQDYNVGLGNTFGKSSGKSYRTVNINH